MTSLQAIHDRNHTAIVAMRAAGIERGVRNLLTQLYPDNAHFIYELLQNAEDAGATQAIFDLQPDALTFKHDGRPFTIKDVDSILSIGETSKADDPTAIGKFGVGFKAVFSYCSTPEIRSGTFAFAIRDLIVPHELEIDSPRTWTEFRFPFDNPSKPADRAYQEICQGLIGLDGSTLLFLTSVQALMYFIPGEADGLIERRAVDDDCIAIIREVPAGAGTEHWLRLTAQVDLVQHDTGERKLIPIAAAFRLVPPTPASGDEPAPNSGTPEPSSLLVQPLEDAEARVSIYFPAVKEHSGLRFHIHAGFASTVARDSVTDDPANLELVGAIGDLIARRLPDLRMRGLLGDEMLWALPNANDTLHVRYASIRDAVLQSFHDHELAPVWGERDETAFAHDLLISPPSFRRAITHPDLDVLATLAFGAQEAPYRWVADRQGRAGAFLRSLGIKEFNWSELSHVLGMIASEWTADEARPTRAADAEGDLETWLTWLESKDHKKLRRIYALFGEGFQTSRYYFSQMKSVPIVRRYRRNKAEHVDGRSTYLPATKSDKAVSRVPVDLSPVGLDPAERETSWLQAFYESAGVKVWNEETKVFERLELYRTRQWPGLDQNPNDVALFRDFLRADGTRADKFRQVPFLVGEGASGDTYWVRPTQLFLDEPYAATGLSDIYFADTSRTWYRLWSGYSSKVDGVAELAELLGCAASLKVIEADPASNPDFDWRWRTGRETSNGPKRDWDLPGFKEAVESGNHVVLRGLWNAVAALPRERARAVYQCNGSTSAHYMTSKLAHMLQTTPWVLDLDGNLRLPPAISVTELAAGMKPPKDGGLLEDLGFGRDAAMDAMQRDAADAVAREAGLPSVDALQRLGSLFEGMDEAEAMALIAQMEATIKPGWDIEGSPSDDPARRREIARDLSLEAPDRTYEIRKRSVSVGSGAQIAEAKAYLRGHYQGRDNRVVCQACRQRMPFQVAGDDYFEAVQLFKFVRTVHHQNRLALCPLCAAKYKHARETSDEDLRGQFDANDHNLREPGVEWLDLQVKLAGALHDLRFAAKHALEVQGILSAHDAGTADLGTGEVDDG